MTKTNHIGLAALAGSLAGWCAATLDLFLVARDTGLLGLSKWGVVQLFLLDTLVFALVGAVGATLVAPLAARLALRASSDRKDPVGEPSAMRLRLFSLWLLVLGFVAFFAVLAFDLWDVRLPLGERHHRLPFAWAALQAAGLSLAITTATTLGARGARGSRRWAALPSLAVLGLVPSIWLGLHSTAQASSSAKSLEGADLVLIVLDTTRADGLSATGNPRRVSPGLDRLAAEGRVYERAYATGTWTPVSHASLFTGALPVENGTYSVHTRLRSELPSLAEVLSERGYRTLFDSSNEVINRADGWTRGFDRSITYNVEDRAGFVHQRLWESRVVRSATPGKLRLARDWIERRQERSEPYFAFLNLIDPHTEFIARQPHFDEYLKQLLDQGVLEERDLESSDSPESRVDWDFIWRLTDDLSGGEHEVEMTEQERAVLRAVYDSEVAYMDWHLGRFLDWLREAHAAAGSGRPLAILVTSDHGELLGEHRLLYHRIYPYEELVRVPFVLWTDRPLATGRSDELVSLVDVFPTLLGLAGVDREECCAGSGRDLLADEAPDVVFAENYLLKGDPGDQRLHVRRVAVGSRFKLIYPLGEPPRLYDLEDDPGEVRDVLADYPEVAGGLESRLRDHYDLDSPPPEPMDSGGMEEIEERRRLLESLGYVN